MSIKKERKNLILSLYNYVFLYIHLKLQKKILKTKQNKKHYAIDRIGYFLGESDSISLSSLLSVCFLCRLYICCGSN